MAIVKFGTTVVGVRGTIGGIVYSANASGPHARLWAKGSNPRSELQTLTRARISGLGVLWAALSDVEKAAWDYFGLHPPEFDTNSLGIRYYLTGWQWLVRVNQRRQSCGLGVTSVLPTNSGVAAAVTCVIEATALPGGTVTLTWTPGDFPGGFSGVLELGLHSTTGLVAKTAGFLQVYAQHEPAGSSADITAAVRARFGDLQLGWKLFGNLYRLRDDGVRSTGLSAACEVL